MVSQEKEEIGGKKCLQIIANSSDFKKYRLRVSLGTIIVKFGTCGVKFHI